LQIYQSFSVADLQRFFDKVNADLKRIYDWAVSNDLNLNPKKSPVIPIQRGVVMCRSLLFIGPDSKEVVSKVRNLGFVLNRNMTPVDHYKAVCQRISSVLRSVKPTCKVHFLWSQEEAGCVTDNASDPRNEAVRDTLNFLMDTLLQYINFQSKNGERERSGTIF
jgi:hypothetical protein